MGRWKMGGGSEVQRSGGYGCGGQNAWDPILVGR